MAAAASGERRQINGYMKIGVWRQYVAKAGGK
jgi:hypothetical protein